MKTQVSTFQKSLVLEALKSSLRMLSPKEQIRNPVMFVTYICTLLTLFLTIRNGISGKFSWFDFQISLWLGFTIFFANFAQSIAESRGIAQAATLRKSKLDAFAKVLKEGLEIKIPSAGLKKGDVFVCEVGDVIAADGEVIEGIATVDESAITGESAPVIRESGGDRSAVTTGTRVVSDRLVIRVTSEPGNSFLDRMISLIENAKRQKTPNEIALNIVLSALSIIFLLVVVSLKLFTDYSSDAAGTENPITVTILAALLVCLMPTTISALLSAVGISGMDRLVRYNVIAKSGRAIEAAGDIDTLILDKTGTITLGNRMAAAFLPASGFTDKQLAEISQLASLSDETPEGRSIVILAKNLYDLRSTLDENQKYSFIPFSAQTRMSGVDILDSSGNIQQIIRKGAVDAVKNYVIKKGGNCPPEVDKAVEMIAKKGGTPLLVCRGNEIAGIIHLKDVIKGGIKRRFAKLRKMGIKTIMVTGDNPLTASAIAAEAGVDDFIAEATPENKLKRIRQEQQGGRLVAMAGDGTNDAPALAQADVGVAMNTGTQASREAGNFVDLDSNPTKLIEIVEIGKQLLMTRGSLTTFSIANDVSKYFAILPAIFTSLYALKEAPGPLSVLNVMHLSSPQSAILSAVIFNALVIVALIPLALKGVKYRAETANELLRKNLFIYGLGGLVLPFLVIKGLDLLIVRLGWAL